MKSIRAFASLLLLMSVVAGCTSTRRSTVEGYDDAALNRKRVFVLLPAAADIAFDDAEQFGASRGVAGVSAAETFEGELRTMLVGELQARLDSNTVLNYAEQPVSGIVALSASSDFTATGPSSWDDVGKAAQEGMIDFLVVLRDVRVANRASSDPRGDETVSATYLLIDPSTRRLMSTGTVSTEVSAPRTPAMTHERLGAALAAKLPFVVG